MANNRTEATSAVNSQMVPEIDASELRDLLNDELIDSLVFRKDVIASETPVAGAVTIDYSTKDVSTITTAINISISFSNIENGDVKFIALTKAIGNTVTFVSATDVSPRKDYIDASLTYVVYRVNNKNGNITVNSINVDNDITSNITAEIAAAILAANGGIKTAIYDLGDWNMDSTGNISIDVVSDLGLTASQIRGYRVFVRGDVGTTDENVVYPINIDTGTGQQGYAVMDNVVGDRKIIVYRTASGLFDSSSFDDTPFNRGWLIVEYM